MQNQDNIIDEHTVGTDTETVTAARNTTAAQADNEQMSGGVDAQPNTAEAISGIQESVSGNPEIVSVNMENEAFSDVLKRARSNKCVTIGDVSHKTHIPTSFISDIENAFLNNLPDLDLCLSRLEKLCIEYDIEDASRVKDNFTEAYEACHQDDESNAVSNRNSCGLTDMNLNHGNGRSTRLPSIILIFAVVLLVALLGYAYFAYRGHQLPPQLNVDLSELVPIHTPEPVYLDEPLKR